MELTNWGTPYKTSAKRRAAAKKRYRANRKKILKAQRKYRREHLEEARAASKKYRDSHPEKVYSYVKAWKQRHPERHAAQSRKSYKKVGAAKRKAARQRAKQS